MRTYRAANIHDAEVTDEAFQPPKHFNLAAHWEKAVREYEAGVYHEHADVRLSPQGVYMLDMLGPYVQREAARTASKPDRRGWVRCRLPLESIGYGIRELMRFGDEVIVTGPPELRTKFAQAASRMARTHGTRAKSRVAKRAGVSDAASSRT